MFESLHRGHGTYVESGEVVASVAGTVEQVNRLVTVHAARTRYNAEVGDLVVGRITEVRSYYIVPFTTNITFQVQPRRWKVDVGSRQDAVLMLSSVNLPGGVQVSFLRELFTHSCGLHTPSAEN